MTDQERADYEALLDEILALRTKDGRTPGIYAAERCQLCATIQAWSGFVSAMAVHHGRDRDFVCRRCRGESAGRRMHREVDAAPTRFCEDCGVALPRSEASHAGGFWCCPECCPRLRVDGALSRLRRRRYIALEHPTLASLRLHASEVRGHKRMLEDLADEWSRGGGQRG
ncbi:MAG TPA: hypothetical protein VL049_20580 [Candidatus Dormibacteraeota bacterium]|nr:hypothetical protein [Candidatus Dormibacteraeota bacterium]